MTSTNQPLPRWGHAAVAHQTKVYVWGGRLEDFSPPSRRSCGGVVDVFDSNTELWEQKHTHGSPPPSGLYNNAHAELKGCMYIYGGFDGHHTYDTLHQLDLTYLKWTALSKPQVKVPMKMTGCGMVTCGDHTLVLFGGFGTPSSEVEPGYTFQCQADDPGNGTNSKKGWTNEVWCYDVEKEEWSCPAVKGDLPPPCADFAFTAIGQDRAVVFGGYQPEIGAVANLYVLDMTTWSWTKIDPPSKDSSPWPKGRDGHASTFFCSKGKSYVLVSGGWDSDSNPLNDTWILDTKDFSWHQLELTVSTGARFWHTVTAVGDSPVVTQLVIFGGCPMGGEKWPKLADTIMVELGFFDPDTKWTIIDEVDHRRLGNPLQRMKERLILSEFHSRQFRGSSLSLGPHTPTHTTPTKELSPVNTPSWSVPKLKVVILKDELGKGRNGTTKVAVYQGRKVAAKCLHSNIVTESNHAMFLESMDVMATLKHPNLVSFIGAILDDAHLVILCELIPLSLKAFLEQRSPLPLHQVVGIGSDVAQALCYLHSTKPLPIVHGELRSTSVLLEPGQGGAHRAKLVSYMTTTFTSLHTDLQNKTPKMPAMKKKSVFVLEAHDPSNPSPKRDTYNLGLLLVEMATGTSPKDVSLAYLMESITFPLVSTVVKRCVEIEPTVRPTMEEVVALLSSQAKLEGAGPRSRHEGLPSSPLTSSSPLVPSSPLATKKVGFSFTTPVPGPISTPAVSSPVKEEVITPTHEVSSPVKEEVTTPTHEVSSLLPGPHVPLPPLAVS